MSHTFHVADSNARGLFKLFSITILMKDKTFLLNTEPFLSQHLEAISKELQDYASKVYEREQGECSQRAQRLNAGKITSNTKRSLVDLTGEEYIYGYLHSHFAWLLWAGARYLSESITLGSPTAPPWIGKDTEEGFTMVQFDKEDFLLKRMGKLDLTNAIQSETEYFKYSLRQLKDELGVGFLPICYCTVTGIQIVIRGLDKSKIAGYALALQSLLPEQMHCMVKSYSEKYHPPEECLIIGLPMQEAIPKMSPNVIHIEFLEKNQIAVKYETKSIPKKLPTLITKINRAVEEQALTELVLEKRLKVLVEEWKNKIQCLQKIRHNQDTSKLKTVLGVQSHDQSLIQCWAPYLR